MTKPVHLIPRRLYCRLVISNSLHPSIRPPHPAYLRIWCCRATLFFEASANADTASTRDDAGSVLAIAHCTADETSHAFCSAIYISAASSGKPLTEETLDFVQAIAPLTAPVLLPPTQNAHRTLAMLAAAGAGDGTPLYEAAVELCDRHCGAQSGTTITIAFAHGDDMVRVVKSTGSSAFRGATAQVGHSFHSSHHHHHHNCCRCY